ncbi:MAG: hypothetical protein KF905_06870 [Flavobacteriales bacterium]|nr:hypothetical protein [Flavobacteriales bacterium]
MLNAGAQNVLVLIIDTVVTPSDGFPINAQEEGSSWWTNDTSDRVTTYSSLSGWNEFPNVIMHVHRDANGLRIALDEDGGELLIRWPAGSKLDTIRIPHFEVFAPWWKDTVYTRKTWYHVNDTSIVPMRSKDIRSFVKHVPARRPKKVHTLSLIINGEQFHIALNRKHLFDEITVGHAYRPTDCGSGAADGFTRRKCKYICFDSRMPVWTYHAEIMLSP